MQNKTFVKRLGTLRDQDDFRKNNLSVASTMINLPTNVETRRRIQRLQKQLRQQTDKRQQVQSKFESFKQRFVNRQRQFHRILQKFNIKQGQSNDDHYVTDIYQKIICTFDSFNEKARELLDERYSELYRLMQRRIIVLISKMDAELNKHRMIAQSQKKQIREAIRDIGVIAAETEVQNVAFRKKNQLLSLKLQMINEQKLLLLQEIVSLKAMISKIKKTVKTQTKLEQTEIVGLNSKTDFWKNNESIVVERLQTQSGKKPTLLTSRKQRYSQEKNDRKTRATAVSLQKTMQFPKKVQPFSSQLENSITHLKQCLTRQKNKNSQLIKFSLELQAKQQKIKDLINEQMNRETTRGSQRSLVHSDAEMNDLQLLLDSRENVVEDGGCVEQVKISGKNYTEINKLKINGKPISKPKPLSQLINEISKILHLPQTMKSDAKNNLKPDNSFLIQDNSYLKPDNSFLKQENSFLKQDNSFFRQDTSRLKQTNSLVRQQIEATFTVQKQMRNSQCKKEEVFPVDLKQQIFSKPNNNSNSQRRRLSAKKQLQQPSSAMGHRPKRYGQNQNTSKSYLFVNYSPLDLIEITKSIEIK